MNASWNHILTEKMQGNTLTCKSLPFCFDNFHQCSKSRKSSSQTNDLKFRQNKILAMMCRYKNNAQSKISVHQINKKENSNTLHIDLTKLTQNKQLLQHLKHSQKRNSNCHSTNNSNCDSPKIQIWDNQTNFIHYTENGSSIRDNPVSNEIKHCVKPKNIDINVNNLILKDANGKNHKYWPKTVSPGLKNFVKSQIISERNSELNETKGKFDDLVSAFSLKTSITPSSTQTEDSSTIRDYQHMVSPHSPRDKSPSIMQQEHSQKNVSNSSVSYKSSSVTDITDSEKCFDSKTLLSKKLFMYPEKCKETHCADKTTDFQDEGPKFQEMLVSLNSIKLVSLEDNLWNQLYSKINEKEENKNTYIETLKENVNCFNAQSITLKPRRVLNRSNAFYSKVRPLSTIPGQGKADIERENSLAIKSTLNENNLYDRNLFYSKAEDNNAYNLPLKQSVTLNPRILGHLPVKYNQKNLKNLEWKFNVLQLQKKVKRYSQNKVTPLNIEIQGGEENCSTSSFKSEVEPELSIVKEIDQNFHENQNVLNDSNPKCKIDVSCELPKEMMFKKSKLYPLAHKKKKKPIKKYQHLLHIKSCLAQKTDRTTDLNSAFLEFDVKKDNSNLESNNNISTPSSPILFNSSNIRRSSNTGQSITSKIPKNSANLNQISKLSLSTEPNASSAAEKETFRKDCLKTFIYNSKYSYIKYEHRKFHQ